ncbi:MAG TPA: hypothetical protein VFP98_09550, partial [Candidatus Polarisedimenticolia bacterium]|nr:hypothetical protein [Candidatus Polarisedimenticolia bacterium]
MTRAAARHRRARLVVGAPGAAPAGTHGDPPLQDLFVDEVRRIKSGDPLCPLIVLVGGNYLRLHLQRLLAVRLGGHANIRFLLLQDLARELGGPVMNLRGLRRLPEHGAGLLIREIVVGRTHGSYFGGIAGKEGFAEALLSTIRDLKEAALEPALLRGAAEGMRASERRRPGSDLSGRKLDDLADLYEAYDDLLAERRFHDDQDLMKAAITRAAPSDQSPAAAIVYGFYDSTWLQRELLREFLSLRETVVLFPYIPGEAGAPAEAFEYARPMLEWFESWIPTDAERDAPQAGPAPAGGPEIRLLSAPGEAREAVEATRWLIDLSRRRSIPFGEMAVLYRTSEPYRDLLPEIMDSVGGVPRFLAEGTALASTPAGRALLLWLDVRREDFSRKSVIDLLSHVSRDSSAALWDRLTRQAGVVKGISDWRRKLERLAATLKHRAEPGDRRARVELQAVQALRRSVEGLREALEGLPAHATWRELAAAFVDRAARILPADAPSEALAYHIEKLGALDEVASPVTLDSFIDRLRASLLEEQVRRAPEGEFQRSGIFVGSVMEARLLSFDAVALVGLVEKVFPAAPRQDPILLDEEREAIDRLAGAPRLPLKARRLEEDRLLFHLACATAGESLLLSYPRLDAASARPRNPSPFLLQAASKLAGDRIDHDALDRLEAMTRVSLAALAPRQTTSAIFAREFDLCALAAGLHDASSRRRVASFLHSGSLLHRALEAEEARWGE